MEKNKKNKDSAEILSCGCRHCHNKEKSHKRIDTNSCTKEYAFGFIKVGLSFILLLISIIFIHNATIDLILCIIATLVSGYNLIIKSIRNIIHKEWLDENTLMLIAAITALCIGEFLEGVLIVSLYNIGELLEEIATDNSKKKIAGLSELKSDVVRLVTRDGIIEVEPTEVEVGSLIEVRSGDRVPIDGVLVGAPAEFDLKAITGESKYYTVENGEKVYSGAINVGNPIIIKTIKKFEDSTVEKIISMVEGSLSKKAKSQRFITSFAKIYTPIIVLCAILVALLPPLFDNLNFIKWLYKSMAFLVISCPCALVISIPLAYFVGIGSLAKHGVLIKGSNYLETLSNVKCAVFDKTGTLTKGNFAIQKISTYNGFEEKLIISYIKALEEKSSHPIALAINKYNVKCLKFNAVNVEEIAGRGVRGLVDGKTVAIGNDKFILENNIKIKMIKSESPLLYVLIDGVISAEITIGDEIKVNARKSMELLKKYGVHDLIMLSGDNKAIAENVGGKLGLNRIYSELLPNQKADKMKEIKSKIKGKVMYVGDGINDSPTLALSDIGVSMGCLGSEIAKESSDMVVMDDDITKIPIAINFSKKIRLTVLQNIIGSLIIKFTIMILSIVINLPVWLAMFADVGVMLLAVLNSIKNKKVR